MHHMLFILVLCAGILGACKTDNSNSMESDKASFTDLDTVTSIEVNDTLTIAKEDKEKPRSVPKEEPKSQTGEVTSVPVKKPKEKPKSTPKPTDPITTGIIEQVPAKVKPKSVPKKETEATNAEVIEVPVQKNNLDHSAWNTLLAKYVSASGKVNYKGLKGEINALNTYLKQLENTDLVKLSRNEKLAFWINAYNAFTIKKILDNYPVSSITNLDGGKPWDVKWINLDGRKLSLNNIENDIIRPRFNEPRIHFAVNCAAVSCPPLLNKAWTGSNLEKHLEAQAKAFVNSSRYNNISKSNIEVSKIFEWYATDFGNLIDYLNKYSNTTINKNATVSYKEYDWALNE